jgi:hypothetical protein
MNMRRKFLLVGGARLCVFTAPLGVYAQKHGKVWRIGFFYFASRQSALNSGRYQAFIESIRDRGYIESRNLVVEARFSEGKSGHLKMRNRANCHSSSLRDTIW